MHRTAVAALFLVLAGTAQTRAQDRMELTAPAEIAEATALDAGIQRLSGKVTPCVEKGGDPQTCLCQNAEELAALKRAFGAAIARHPEWRGRTLAFSNAQGSYSWNIVMPGLERALLATCP